MFLGISVSSNMNLSFLVKCINLLRRLLSLPSLYKVVLKVGKRLERYLRIDAEEDS